jgi:hypothetical protein
MVRRDYRPTIFDVGTPQGGGLAEKAPDNLASLRVPRATSNSRAASGLRLMGLAYQKKTFVIEIPTLIIGHDIDYIHPLSYAAAVSQLIPRSQLVSVTPKAPSKATYLKDFHTAVTNFLETFLKSAVHRMTAAI